MKITQAMQIEFLRNQLSTNQAWAERACIRIFEAQTNDEQVSRTTNHSNGIGFTQSDANFLSGCARTIQYRKHVTENQLPWMMRKISKYARQLYKADCFDKAKLLEIMQKQA